MAVPKQGTFSPEGGSPATGPDGAPTGPPAPAVGFVAQAKRMVRIFVAFTLIAIGALFGLVPFIPGWPLGLLGLSMLAAEFVWARRLLKRFKREGVRLRDALSFRKTRKPKKPRRSRGPQSL